MPRVERVTVPDSSEIGSARLKAKITSTMPISIAARTFHTESVPMMTRPNSASAGPGCVTLPSANAGLVSVRPHLAGSASGLGGALYVGGLVLQYPIGWLSDRMDRRRLIMGLSAIAAVVMLLAAVIDLPFVALLVVAMLLGGITNPVYALLIAYTNDFLAKDDMAAASAGMILRANSVALITRFSGNMELSSGRRGQRVI